MNLIRKAFISWIVAATGLSSAKVIWSNQNIKRPDRPYITLFLTDFVEIGREYTGHPDPITGVATIVINKELTIQLQYIGDKLRTVDPVEELLNVSASLDKLEDYKILQDENIAFVTSLLGPTDISLVKDVEFENRGALDLKFRIPWSILDTEQGVIEASIIESTIIQPDLVTSNITLITVDTNP